MDTLGYPGTGQQRIEVKGPGVLENVEVRDIDTGNYLPAERADGTLCFCSKCRFSCFSIH